MAVLECFGLSHFTDAFKQQGDVHKVWNLLSLEPNLHRKFDTLDLWLEGASQVCCSETCHPYQLTMSAAEPLQGLCVQQVYRAIHTLLRGSQSPC